MHKFPILSESDNTSNLDEEDSVAAAGALVQFGGGSGAVEAGGDEVSVKIREGGHWCVCEAFDEDVFVLVLSNGQVLGARRQEV